MRIEFLAKTTILLTMACTLCVFGCTPRRPEAKTSGVVRFDGRPVPEALVTFVNRDLGVLMTAPVDAAGRYRMLGAKGVGLPPGQYQIYVQPKSFFVRVVTGEAVTDKPSCPADIPEKYHATETSGLTCTIRDGDNTFDIDMTP